MPRYFLYNTPLVEMEIMMQQPPNYKPRRNGIQICEMKNTDSEKRLHGKCIEAFIKTISDRRLTERVHSLFSPGVGTPYADGSHRLRTKAMATAIRKDSTPEIAAAFLLSADPVLWLLSMPSVSDGNICFSSADTCGANKNRQLILRTAKDLYLGRRIISLNELCDPNVVDDYMFRLIISAFVIRRHGLPLSKLP